MSKGSMATGRQYTWLISRDSRVKYLDLAPGAPSSKQWRVIWGQCTFPLRLHVLNSIVITWLNTYSLRKGRRVKNECVIGAFTQPHFNNPPTHVWGLHPSFLCGLLHLAVGNFSGLGKEKKRAKNKYNTGISCIENDAIPMQYAQICSCMYDSGGWTNCFSHYTVLKWSAKTPSAAGLSSGGPGGGFPSRYAPVFYCTAHRFH